MWVEKCPLCLALRKTLGVVVNVDARMTLQYCKVISLQLIKINEKKKE